MLDTETKRRIDTARDILVGKVPDPKSQVEQITIALIFKFMDDMDAESEEMGGDRTFFRGEFQKYSWTQLMAPGIGGFEMLSLYADAIQKMNINPNIPQLFRDIFKNAFLPYREPETLKSFLKIIDDFNYDHSERLGDAFEYLLSVLGSQGDAGQFRTPRHIIDFMVAIADPKKDETIIDPACGTAGFLISAFKHILKSNSTNFDPATDKHAFELHGVKLSEVTINGKHYTGDKLSPDERNRVLKNIRGYDISPDMVRLSLVNLYLHGFTDPHIFEYDTLTSDDRWNEFGDVILANPPFMSPKGGIRPHKRFSVSSNRSEVLFVDYMAEHLTLNGRAMIVVPEGIIFQSGTAYKSLRKMLVDDNFLVGVISLPAGVFNPYSGVKTSILWLDKNLAKRTDKILFAKVQADGFDLGAQRRSIKQNDLPAIFRQISDYKNALLNNEDYDFDNVPNLSLVEKDKIGENDDYNLSADRYRIDLFVERKYDWSSIGEIVDLIKDGDWIESKDQSDSGIRLIQTGNVGTGEYLDKKENARFISKNTFNKLNCTEVFTGDVLVSRLPDPVGRACQIPNLNTKMITAVDCSIVRFNQKRIIPKLFVYYTKSDNYYEQLLPYLTGASRRRISRKNLEKMQIPLPPLSVQEEIVAEIEGYQKIIDGARQVVENYKPHITIDPDWEMVELKNIAVVNDESINPSELYQDWFNYIDITCVENETGLINYNNKILTKNAPSRARRIIRQNDVLLSTVRPNLKAFGFIDKELNRHIASTGFAVIKAKENYHPKFLYYLLFQDVVLDQMINRMGKGAYPSINQTDVNEIKIPNPSFEIQKQLSEKIEKEQELVKANKEIIKIFEQKIKD